jgi:hypothetical protein
MTDTQFGAKRRRIGRAPLAWVILGLHGIFLSGCFMGGGECPHVEPCFSVEADGCLGFVSVTGESAEMLVNDAVYYALGETAPDSTDTDAWSQCAGTDACRFVSPCEVGPGTLHLRSEGYQGSSVSFNVVKDPDSGGGSCSFEGCRRVEEITEAASLTLLD